MMSCLESLKIISFRVYPILLKSLLVIIFFSFSACDKEYDKPDFDRNGNDDTATISARYRGMDLSFQSEIEEAGVTYNDKNNTSIDLLPFLKQKGVNLIRLRLWHTPASAHSTLEEVTAFAKRIADLGFDFLLDIHYSDTWADPGDQNIPAAWSDLDHEDLKDSVYQYTKMVITHLSNEGATPTIVQIGNETNSGFLWDMGRVGGSYDSNWNQYAELVNSAIRGVNDAEGDHSIRIMFHYAGIEGASWYFDKLNQYSVNYDLIGVSYYPFWHGKNLNTVKTELENLATQFEKGIIIAEIAYPWTLGWNDWTHNLVGEEGHLIPEYEATPEGQLAFFNKINEIMGSISQERGLGFVYWAPDWVAYKGAEATDGSAWENMAVFDFDFNALPVLDAFQEPE